MLFNILNLATLILQILYLIELVKIKIELNHHDKNKETEIVFENSDEELRQIKIFIDNFLNHD